MLKRVLVIFTIVAVVNATMYCTHQVRQDGDEFSRRLGKITGLVLPVNDTVRFSPEGATYNSRTGFVVGVSEEGKEVGISIRNLDLIIVETMSDAEVIEIGLKPRRFAKRENAVRTTKVVGVVLKDGMSAEFSEIGARYNPETRAIEGVDDRFMPREFAIDDVDYVYVKQTNVFGTVLAVAVVATVVVGLILLISDEDEPAPPPSSGGESCPFVYSWDGTVFALDAEPLGGATNRAFERTDLSVLELATPDAESYDLLVTNEMLETQYLDKMSLLIVEHPENTKVAPDLDGHLLVYASPQAPIKAVDELGQSVLGRVEHSDGIYWQSEMALPAPGEDFNHRHELTFEFAVPEGATRGRLIYRMGTSLWGAEMVRKMYEARGDELEDWYREMEAGSMQALQALQFLDREELYWLKLTVADGETSRYGGILAGGGPFVTETHALDIAIPADAGEKVTLKIQPPRGYWTVDYMAMEFGEYGEAAMTEIPALSAIDESGRDVSNLLREADKDYYVMSARDTWAKLNFSVPPALLQKHHTAVLSSTGYYQLILPQDRPADTALIARMMQTPGAIVGYSLEQYVRWADSVNTFLVQE